MAANHLTGGYDRDFVNPPPDSLTCPICHLPFRDPHLLSCCGANFCESCIKRVKEAGKPCPLCKQSFTSMLNKGIQRAVLDLKVHCSRKKDGCEKVCELRHLDKHEREECGWALAQCRYKCGRIPRCQLVEHEVDECPLRPMDVKLKSSMRKKEECHQREMAAVREQMTRELDEQKQEYEAKMEQQKKEYEAKMKQSLKEMRGELHKCCNGRPDNSLVS